MKVALFTAVPRSPELWLSLRFNCSVFASSICVLLVAQSSSVQQSCSPFSSVTQKSLFSSTILHGWNISWLIVWLGESLSPARRRRTEEELLNQSDGYRFGLSQVSLNAHLSSKGPLGQAITSAVITNFSESESLPYILKGVRKKPSEFFSTRSKEKLLSEP